MQRVNTLRLRIQSLLADQDSSGSLNNHYQRIPLGSLRTCTKRQQQNQSGQQSSRPPHSISRAIASSAFTVRQLRVVAAFSSRRSSGLCNRLLSANPFGK